ncbi:MAG: hypothetical protein KBC20_04745 [Oscillospiraceae bacterium]|nr:hypothetical protein [Oscillospiraceae bacterium]
MIENRNGKVADAAGKAAETAKKAVIITKDSVVNDLDQNSIHVIIN